MNNIPRWALRTNKFKRNYKIFLDNYDEKQLDDTGINLKNCYFAYWQYLRDRLREIGVNVFLPTEIYKKAEEYNIAEDTEICLNYINDFNLVLQTRNENNEEKADKIKLYVINKYKEHLKNIYDTIDNYYRYNHLNQVRS